jgi:aryl-alcohol dehydrogenase-like predicted oxidoreductase
MEQERLGKQGLIVSAMGLGCMGGELLNRPTAVPTPVMRPAASRDPGH